MVERKYKEINIQIWLGRTAFIVLFHRALRVVHYEVGVPKLLISTLTVSACIVSGSVFLCV